MFQFRARFYRGPLAALSALIGELLLQLNSRLPAVQRAAAALLQLVLRGGYTVTFGAHKAFFDYR